MKITIWSNKPDECEINHAHKHIKEDGDIAHMPGTLEDKSTLLLSRKSISDIE